MGCAIPFHLSSPVGLRASFVHYGAGGLPYAERVDLLVVGGPAIWASVTPASPATTAGGTFRTGTPPDVGVHWHNVDIRRADDVRALILRTRPTALINAAYSRSDWATTADGAVHVAMAAAAIDARLVHVSSDAVFSGRKATYDEADAPDPITPYGKAKAAAEALIEATVPAAAIDRTSLIVGHGGSQHEQFVHALASGVAPGFLFADDTRCPVHVTDLACALLELAASVHVGIQHVAGADAVSRYELGVLIAQRDRLDVARLPKGLRATSAFAGAKDVRLDCRQTQARLTTRLHGANEFLCRAAATAPASR